MSETMPLIKQEYERIPKEVRKIHVGNYNCVLGVIYFVLCMCLFPVFHLQIFVCFVCFLPIFALIFVCLPCLLPSINKQRPHHAPFIARVFSYVSKNFLTVFPRTLISGWEPIMDYVGSINQSDTTVKYHVKTIEYRSEKHNNENFRVKLHIYEPSHVNRVQEDGYTVLLYFHGGGFIMGHPMAFNYFFKEMIRSSNRNYILIAPRYKLASSGHKVDSIVREAVKVLTYVVSEYTIPAKSNEGDKNTRRVLPRICLSGDSCGGKLSMLVSNYLRDTGYKILPKENIHVIPLYPPVMKRNQQIQIEKEEEEEEDLVTEIDISENNNNNKNNNKRKKIIKRNNNEEEEQQMMSLESRDMYGRDGYVFTSKGYEEFVYPSAEQDDCFINHVKKSYNEFDFFEEVHLMNLPSFFFITAEYCIFRSECELYCRFLKQMKEQEEELEVDGNGNNTCEYHDVKNEIHGFTAQRCVTIRGKSSLDEVVRLMNESIERRFFVEENNNEEDDDDEEKEEDKEEEVRLFENPSSLGRRRSEENICSINLKDP